MLYWIVRASQALSQALPRSIGYALAVALGDLTLLYWRLFDRRRYRSVLKNAAWVTGGHAASAAAWQIARESVRNYCRYLWDFLRFPSVGLDEIERSVVVKGWEHIDRALAAGRGVIMVGLHMGNWDVGGAALALRNYPVTVVADAFEPRRLDDLVQGMRRAKGLQVISAADGVRALTRALRENQIVGLLVDRPVEGGGVSVEFCGGMVEIPAGAAMLALRTRSVVVPAGMVRLPDNRYLALLEPHLEFEPAGNLRTDVQALSQRMLASLERMVRQYPDQWFMFRDMWAAERWPA